MSIKRMFTTPVTVLFVTALMTTIWIGGCPVAQQPTNSSDQNNNDQNSTPTTNNQRPAGRPIPPPPAPDDEDTGTGGGTGSSTDNGTGSSGEDAGQTFQPLSSVVTAPDVSDINILPGGEGAITYEVFGGNPSEGAIDVKLFYDKDGVKNSGDEATLESALALRGTERFNATLPTGTYFIGIRAANNKEVATTYASAKLVVVGEPKIAFAQPSADLRIRPGTAVTAQLTIESLATSISYSVFTDTDTTVNGNETPAFNGGGLGGSGTILTDGYSAGVHYVGVTVQDSLGQKKTQYFTGTNGALRTITIDLVPTVKVTTPTDNQVIAPGTPITINLNAGDPEANADVTVFRDADGSFNGNEFPIGQFKLTQATNSFVVDFSTAGLAPGTYKFGASITDGVSGASIFSYAPGSIRLNSPPLVNVTFPTADQNLSAGDIARVEWTATDQEGKIQDISVILAPDANGDHMPDDAGQILQNGFPLGTQQYSFSTATLVGQYVVGVRVTDDVGAKASVFATGGIIVRNDAPTVLIQEPTAAQAVRPGTAVFMQFTVGDRESALKPQPDGIQVVLARDTNLDGQPDGPPVFSVSSSFFRRGDNFYSLDTSNAEIQALLDQGGNGYFLLGVRAADQAGNVTLKYAPGGLAIDSVVPKIELVSPAQNIVKDRVGTLSLTVRTIDTSASLFWVVLDKDTVPLQGDNSEFVLVQPTVSEPGTVDHAFDFDLSTIPAGLYFIYVVVTDGVQPLTSYYAPPTADQSDPDQLQTIHVRDRLMGVLDLEKLAGNNPNGGILQGFSFNDLGGSSMARVPDVNGDGADEFVIVSRFGKPFIINGQGVGFGEAYLVYGDKNKSKRLKGAQSLNAIGRGSIPGLAFPGIRIQLNKAWTEGISDVAVVDDMDGDELPEIVFSFPRVESLNLGAPAFVMGNPFQHPELLPDLPGMGALEYDAINYMSGTFTTNKAQFTRGGIVIVSSHNTNITNPLVRNRKNDRVLDLHEVGQMFSTMSRASLVPYIIGATPAMPPTGCSNCDNDPQTGGCGGSTSNETAWTNWTVLWDEVLSNQPPGGFLQPWTDVPIDPPLANPSTNPWTMAVINMIVYPPSNGCSPVLGCKFVNAWYKWGNCGAGIMFPNTTLCGNVGWHTDNAGAESGLSVWTGFYGPAVTINNFSIGARVMGQKVDDRFGTAVGSDGHWLYISAPRHKALKADVPTMSADRDGSGVVYQLRTDARTSASAPTKTQLWMEPYQIDDGNGNTTTATWPNVDAEGAKGADYTMPVPHQYIIEDIGSLRGNAATEVAYNFQNGGCPPDYSATGGAQASASSGYRPYPVDRAGYFMDRTPQIVGPHTNAKISYVRGMGDVNDDGINDFAVGSDTIRDDFNNANSPIVGAIFIVYSRSTGQEGDYLLERLALPVNDQNRLTGVLVKGKVNEPIARVFDTAGDFNGDGVADVIVGSEQSQGTKGAAIVILGSRTLSSPTGGYTADQMVTDGRAIRFIGEAVGDLAGANVAGAGDVDGDGMGDILIAAPGAVVQDQFGEFKQAGATYLIYGTPNLSGDINLSQVGTAEVPGVKFLGRQVGDALGAGTMQLTVNPDNQPTNVFSRGVAALGDIDGDGLGDYAIGAMLAGPNGKVRSGEVYILYGRGDQP